MKWLFITAAVILSSLVGSSHGTGHVVVTLTSYENPRNHKDDGECCDPLGPFLKYKNCLPCNTYFKLCVKDSFNKRAPCIGQATTRLLNKEERRFTIRNDFPFDSLARTISLSVDVYDKDYVTSDDVIEKLTRDIVLPAVRRDGPKRNYNKATQELTGSRVVVTVQVEMYCDKHFYGNKCNVNCVPQNDESRGSYDCDNLGTKICKKNWFGANCNRKCVPLTGRSYCDLNGNRRCLPNRKWPSCESCVKNWFGSSCSSYCEPQDSEEQGHYKCREDGKKDCLPWWYGTECRTHCIPHDDYENGHYSCAHDGSKTCKYGWHGANCTVYCVPHDNDAAGHYTCDIHGNKVCLDGYRPPDCKECLLGRHGANCSLTCHNSTQTGYYDCTESGSKKCRQWWYGPDCHVYCVPHDDNVHGHYKCDPRDGSKVCEAGWEGPDCLSKNKN